MFYIRTWFLYFFPILNNFFAQCFSSAVCSICLQIFQSFSRFSIYLSNFISSSRLKSFDFPNLFLSLKQYSAEYITSPKLSQNRIITHNVLTEKIKEFLLTHFGYKNLRFGDEKITTTWPSTSSDRWWNFRNTFYGKFFLYFSFLFRFYFSVRNFCRISPLLLCWVERVQLARCCAADAVLGSAPLSTNIGSKLRPSSKIRNNLIHTSA